MPLVGFTLALLISTLSILSIGFLIASIVPTARFAQPLGAVILYPMLGRLGAVRAARIAAAGLCAVARVLPLTYAVSLLQGIWTRRPVVRAPGRRRGARSRVRRLHGDLDTGIPVGMKTEVVQVFKPAGIGTRLTRRRWS